MKMIVALLILFAGIHIAGPAVALPAAIQQQDARAVIVPDDAPGRENILLHAEKGSGFSIMTLFRGMLGMTVLILLGFLLSSNRRNIPWGTVATGLFIQVLLAIGVLYIPVVRIVFEFFGHIFVKILDFTKAGSQFLLGDLMNIDSYGFIFLFQVLPTIIFFFRTYQPALLLGDYSKSGLRPCLGIYPGPENIGC